MTVRYRSASSEEPGLALAVPLIAAGPIGVGARRQGHVHCRRTGMTVTAFDAHVNGRAALHPFAEKTNARQDTVGRDNRTPPPGRRHCALFWGNHGPNGID